MALFSLTKDDDYASRKAAIARQEKLAEMLSQMGAQEQAVSTAGGIAAPVSGMGALARGLTSFGGSYLSGKAAADEAALKKEQGESRAKALELYFQNPDTTMTMPGGSYQTDQKGEALPKYLLDDAEAMAAGPATKTVSLPDITSNVAGGPTSYADRVRMAYQFAAGDDEKLAAMAPMLLAATQPEAERERVRAQESAIPKPVGVSDAAWNAAGGIPGSRTEIFNKSLETAITPEKRSAEYTRLVDSGYTPGTPEFKAQMDRFNRKDTYIAPVTGPAPGTPKNYTITGQDGKPVQKFLYPAEAKSLADAGNQVSESLATKRVPATLIPTIGANFSAIKKIDASIEELTKNPTAVGLMRSGPNWFNQIVNPSGTTARAIIADIGSLKLHDRSGAAVNASESPRLMPFIPQVNDPFDAAIKKLRQFRNEYDAIVADQATSYSDEEGYVPPAILTKAQQYIGDRNRREALLAKQNTK